MSDNKIVGMISLVGGILLMLIGIDYILR